MGENHFAAVPVALYAFNLLMCAVAYTVMLGRIIRLQGHESVLAKAIGTDVKGKISLLSYIVAIPLALLGYAWLAGGLLLAVALIWLIPDRRIERVLID